MNAASQIQNECVFIEGKLYENLKQFDCQGVQSITFIGNQTRNENENFIIKLYKEISDEQIEVLQQIKKYQNQKIPKCQHMIKIIGIQNFLNIKKDRKFYVVMEKGKDNTQNLIKSNISFSLFQKFKIFEQMVRGEMELHSLGYFQINLKPQSFVYFETQTQNYQVKLIDFGSIKHDSTYFKTKQIETFNYLAPEVIQGNQLYNKTVNIWSLGIILYELLVSEDFFLAKNKQEMKEQMQDLTQDWINKNINKANCLGQTEKDLINSMLQIESKKRIQLEILLQKIDQYLTNIQEYQKRIVMQLSVIKTTNQQFIQNLMEKLNKINQIETAEQKKKQLVICINKEIKKYQEILNENEQRLQQIQQAKMKDEFIKLEQEIFQVNQQQQLQEYNLIMEKITKELRLVEQLLKNKEIENQQKLKKEKEQFINFLEIIRNQFRLQSNQIQTLSEQYNLNQRDQKQINEQEKYLNVRKQHQKMEEEIKELEQSEVRIMVQCDEQKITIYQQFNTKLKEIQQAQNVLKILIEEASKSILSFNAKIFEENSNQIDNLNDKLTDYLDKFQYQSKNQKYSNKIVQIMNQIKFVLEQLNSLKKQINQCTQTSYQQFNKNYYEIEELLRYYQKQYNQLHEQIYNDELIEQINLERIKKIKMTQNQLDQIKKKMNQLKDQIKYLFHNKYLNYEQIYNLINNKLIKIDQNIIKCQKKFENFIELNLLNSYEIMKNQIKLLQEVQRKLDRDVNEIEYNIDQFKLIISKIETENESEEKKEIFNLNTQLQETYRKFSKALNSIHFQFESIELYKQMKVYQDNFQVELKQEIQTLKEYLEVQNINTKLFQIEMKMRDIKNNKQQQLIVELLQKLQQTNQQKGYRLKNVFNRVCQKQQELNFCFMDNNLIKNYEYLKMQESQLSIELNLINQKTYDRQLNSQELIILKEQILQVQSNIFDLIMKIPKKNKIQEFNKAYQQNLESYEKLLALVNYIKQYHLTRYYERLKENKFKKQNKQQIQKESNFDKSFQSLLNDDQEKYAINEKEAQDKLQKYENIVNNIYNMMTKEIMEKDKQQMEKQLIEIESQIKQQNLAILESNFNDPSVIENIIYNRKIYKLNEFAQTLILYK
ncbi:unnamed protein product [Paramecium primaurelia]|uniref:non-specific serine/threonine protein kinase n=1 Tax=Paramecium primaurelia TaxID=5886 RepID=A0A8S1KJV2_PARPR|nr:unnamed protein product [Paramecium primaurelia]